MLKTRFSCLVAPLKNLVPLLCSCLFLLQFSFTLSDVPLVKLIQDIICKEHLGIAQSDELVLDVLCDGEEVQRRLNLITIGMMTAATIAGALVALPFGMLADRFGRVPVLAISLVGMLLSLGYCIYVLRQQATIPLEALWGSGVAVLIGGGRGVFEAMIFAMVSDVTPTSRQATAYQFIVGSVLLGQLAGTPLGGFLMRSSIWMPLYVSSLNATMCSIVLVLTAPETRPRNGTKEVVHRLREAVHIPRRQTLRALFSLPAVLLLPGAVLVMPVATVQSEILLRAMPVLFEWTLEKSSLLLSVRTIVTLVTLTAFLPSVSWLCSKKMPNCQPLRRDLVLARFSAGSLILGSICLLMVKNESLMIMGVVVSALGSGVPTLCRGMLSNILHKHQAGFLFSTLAIGEVLAMLALQAGMGGLFDIGLEVWPGLPFCLALVVTIGVGIAAFCVRFPAFGSSTELDELP